MDISKKILKFAENQKTIDEKLHGDFSAQYDNGYNTGYSKGKTDGYADGYDVGLVDGAASVPNPLEYASTFYQAFSGAVFPENYELTIDVPRAINLTSLFQNSRNLVKLTIKGNVEGKVINFNSTFRAPHLIILDLSGFNVKIGTCSYMCYDAISLKEIIGILDLSECTNATSWLNNCKVLEEIRFLENSIGSSIGIPSSPKLTLKSIQSIIDGLATVETAQTLTLHSTVSSALTDDQMAQIVNKNWQLV